MVLVVLWIYRLFVTYGKNGEEILYVTLQRAIYGCMRSALLFYLKLLSNMEGLEFRINPLYMCVANNVTNGKHMTIT